MTTDQTLLPCPHEQEREEWFFRWAARAVGGHTSMESAIGMIWHHPNNPYFKSNPWQTDRTTVPANIKDDLDLIRNVAGDLEQGVLDNGKRIRGNIGGPIMRACDRIERATVPAPIDFAEILSAMEGVKELVDCDCPEDPDDESVGWHKDAPMKTTFGDLRRFNKAVQTIKAALIAAGARE